MVTKKKTPLTPLSHVEVVTLAVYLLGGKTRPADTEDVAVRANSLAPGRFSWRKYPEQINLDAVRKRLWDAQHEEGYLTGSVKQGWMLTEPGLVFAQGVGRKIDEQPGVQKPPARRDDRWQQRERTRMMATDAFTKYQSGNGIPVTKREAESFFRVDDYITGNARRRKLDRLLNSFKDDRLLGPVVKAMAKLVTEELANG